MIVRARALVVAAVTAVLLAGPVRAGGPEPAPPYPRSPTPERHAPPPRWYPPPPPPGVAPPPPLSPVMRVVYAPFYAAGLVLRYGLYYGIVAPLEVFSRTLSYGVEGGVARRTRRAPPPEDDGR
jgi:hypothetical protein